MRSSQATGTSEEDQEKDLVRQEDGLDEPAVPNPVSRRLPGFGTPLLILMPAFFPSRPLVVLYCVFETLAIRRQGCLDSNPSGVRIRLGELARI